MSIVEHGVLKGPLCLNSEGWAEVAGLTSLESSPMDLPFHHWHFFPRCPALALQKGVGEKVHVSMSYLPLTHGRILFGFQERMYS